MLFSRQDTAEQLAGIGCSGRSNRLYTFLPPMAMIWRTALHSSSKVFLVTKILPTSTTGGSYDLQLRVKSRAKLEIALSANGTYRFTHIRQL
mgnify:CR=1 FL=1